MINGMLDVRLTDLDQEDIIVYKKKKINLFILKDKSLYLTEVNDIRLFSYKNEILFESKSEPLLAVIHYWKVDCI